MKDYLRIIRPMNLVFIAILIWVMEKWVAVPVLGPWGEQLPWWYLLLLILSVAGIAGGGYVINDYFDVKIDRINRPERLIVTASLSKTQAMNLFRILTAIGVVCGLIDAWVIRSMSLALVILFVPGLLWFYSSSYKRQFLIGNLTIAFASALVPIVVALANVGTLRYHFGDILPYTSLVHDLYAYLGSFALFAFMTTWVREIVKDMQDQMGDRELECHTMPIQIGELWTKIVLTLFLGIIIALIIWFAFYLVPFPHDWHTLNARYVVFGLIIPLLGEICLIWAARIPSDYHTAQLLMKFIMLMGTLYGFVIEHAL